jgi:hypothetical protein
MSAIGARTYWVGMFDALNGLMKDDNIWIVQVAPIAADGREVTPKLFENAEEWTFDSDKPAGGTTAKDKAVVTDLHVVAINRNGENAGANAVEYFKSIANSPATKEYFEFQSKNEDELVRKYLIHQVGDTALKYGYAFKMRLPLKRKVEVTIRPRS